MMKYLFNLIVLLVATFVLSACQTSHDTSASIENKYGFKKTLVKGGDFWITTYQKIADPSKPYVFYIEGDGLAFNGKYRVSSNPTPRKQMLIRLASMDNRPNVVYVARPCQYTEMELNPKCNPEYWTSKRLSDDSVQALNEVINSINHNRPTVIASEQSERGNPETISKKSWIATSAMPPRNDEYMKFSLVGFSGGGGIALLIAARNPFVSDIITIAGNLDHVAFTTIHNVTPMTGSLNPIDYASQIKQIPQLHLSGSNDNIIPPSIAEKFVRESSSSCVKQKIYKNVSHQNGWEQVWGEIYTQPIRCDIGSIPY